MDKINFNEEEILGALERSGYMFESEISKLLSEEGFFIETNTVIKDPFTGKSREIDLIAEFYEQNDEYQKNKCFTKVKYVFEIKNNSAPIVLLTELESNPNIQDWEGLKECWTIPTDLVDFYNSDYWDKLVISKKFSIFTQYCSFQKKNKNDEMMALHPDNIYAGLSKISQYCEQKIESFNLDKNPDQYLRLFLYLPILLISDDLYELKYNDEKIPKLNKSECSLLLYNYHYNEEPKMSYVFVVTRNGLKDLLNFMMETEKQVFDNLVQLRKKDVT